MEAADLARAGHLNLGELLARDLLSRGVPAVTLQASPMGEPVYRRLGFDTLYRYETWVRLAG